MSLVSDPSTDRRYDDGRGTETGSVLDDEALSAEAADYEAEHASAAEELLDDDAAAAVEVDLDLARAAAERDEYLEALRRLQADFENFKKRTIRQQTEMLERAGEDLITKLLPVLDTIDLARQHGEGDAVGPVAGPLLDVLGKEGLERVDPVGQPFDPNEHEAVVHEPSDEGDTGQVVSGLMRAGWKWRGRVIRPAMVAVKG